MENLTFTLHQLAELTNSTLKGNKDHIITGIADLETATENEASFFANPLYLQAMKESSAGVIFVDESFSIVEGKNFLISKNPSKAFQTLAEKFFDFFEKDQKFDVEGIHETALVHETALLGKNVTIAPYAVIDAYVSIQDNTYIGPNTYVGKKSKIGEDCHIFANVSILERAVIGDRVLIQSGAVIGTHGFGYTTDKTGKHEKIKQLGNVVIEDDVEIGANTTVDRARFKTTKIGRGSKIGNLVQISHGVKLGEDNLLIGQVGIAGSSTTGNRVVMAGQTATVGHVTLADGVILAGRAAASKSLTKENGRYGGVPAMPISEHHRLNAHFRRLGKYAKKIKELEERLNSIDQTV